MRTSILIERIDLNGFMRKLIALLFFTLVSFSLHAQTKVLAFAGSARENSINKKLVIEAAHIARERGADVTFIDLKDYPLALYDADCEAENGMPENAHILRNFLKNSDVILIASPEYNSSLTGLLKNIIDWASRNEQNGSREAFKGKRFAIMSASPGLGGGAKGLIHLRTILEDLGGIVVPQQVVVPRAYQAFDEKGKLKDQKLQAELQQLIKHALH